MNYDLENDLIHPYCDFAKFQDSTSSPVFYTLTRQDLVMSRIALASNTKSLYVYYAHHCTALQCHNQVDTNIIEQSNFTIPEFIGS